MRALDAIRKTFWNPQNLAINAFEDATLTTQQNLPLSITVDEAKPMRVIITCGCGKSRCLNCMTLKFQRSCGLFMSIPLIYQFLNKEVFGGFLYMETDGELHPEWIDKDREVLVICSKKAKALSELTPQQYAALFKQKVTLDDVALNFTVTTDEKKIYSFLKNAIRRNKRCLVLSTYHSAYKLRNVTDRLASSEDCLFGLTFYDEAHTIFTASGKRDYLYKTEEADEDSDEFDDEGNEEEIYDDDEEELDQEDESDSSDEKAEPCWKNLKYWGHRVFATATQSTRMLGQSRHLGDELINYSFGDAVRDGIVRDYDLYIHLYRDAARPESRLETHLRIMGKAMKDCDRRRVLCFHSYTNETEKQGTAAKKAEEHKSVIAKELGVPTERVWTYAVTGTMSEEQRMKIFNEFQDSHDDEIYRVLFNCRVVGTGIDLKCIDMVSFIDPRRQPVIITQNIFRGTRKNPHDDRRSAVFLPVMVEGEAIRGATKEDRDAMIKQQLHDSCYKQLAEFLHCLKQHDVRWEDILKNDDKKDGKEQKDDKGKEELDEGNRNIRDRVKVTVDSNIDWDIDVDDLRDMTLQTVRLIGISSDQQSAKEKAQIAFNFIIENYENAAPLQRDTTIIPNFRHRYGRGSVGVGYVYCNAKVTKKKKRAIGVYAELAQLFDSSDYGHWHDLVELPERTDKEKAKIAFDFILENYQKAPPLGRDGTVIPKYGNGKIGNIYQRAKGAKFEGKTTGVNGELAQLLDGSDYKHWHDLMDNKPRRPERKQPQQTDEEKAKIAFDFLLEKYQEAPPSMIDKTVIPNYANGNVKIGYLYQNAKVAKKEQRTVGMMGKFVNLLDASDYKHWHDYLKKPKQTDKEKAQIAFEFIVGNFQDAPPVQRGGLKIPNYGDGNVKIGSVYREAKVAKREQRTSGVYGNLAQLLDSSDYTHWHKGVEQPQQTDKEKAKIALDFILEKYQKAPPAFGDRRAIPNYGDGTVIIGPLYQNAKVAKKEQRTTGLHVEFANLLDGSDYKHWHNFHNEPKRLERTQKQPQQTDEEKAKIAFNFVLENYQQAAPLHKDATIIPNYGIGKIGNVYDCAKQAKRKEKTTGVFGHLAQLFDSSNYEHWHNLMNAQQTAKRPRGEPDEPDDDDDDDDDAQEIKQPPKKMPERCAHVWKEVKTDDTHRYVVCELCDRNSKQRRVAAEKGYKESNPDKKAAVNNWLAHQDYLPGCAWLLDSHGMKTTRALVTGKRFRPEEIVVPEYDDDVYEANSQDGEFGSCLRRGDFLDNLKRAKPDDVSLIYADFTGRYDTFVKPLFQHLEETRLRAGTFVGVTWSNNGAGTQTERSKIDRDLGSFMQKNEFEEINDPVVSESGYGEGGNMNIQFMIKK